MRFATISSLIVQLKLPWPPTSNTYWRRNGNFYFISKKGRDYRDLVVKSAAAYREAFPKVCRLSLHVNAFPPDKRKRDLDNLFKSLLDSLQHANIFEDDSQIDELSIIRMPDYKGHIEVFIQEI